MISRRTNLKCALTALALGTGWLASAKDCPLDPRTCPPGSIVRLVARWPLVNVKRAEVVLCTTNQITVKFGEDTFSVLRTNLKELIVVEAPPPPPVEEVSADSTNAVTDVASSGTGTNRTSALAGRAAASGTTNQTQGLWGKIKELWRQRMGSK
ncbi:MAG: hypothetical protein HZA90_16750 [Verrucomicrobia bacterium]|nr:hypothetical protein [Verrucomicrobiota bacterium]